LISVYKIKGEDAVTRALLLHPQDKKILNFFWSLRCLQTR